VLARLLKLNRDRAAEEIHGGIKRRKEPATPTAKVSKTPQTSTIPGLDI
jgi:hypothetical protein